MSTIRSPGARSRWIALAILAATATAGCGMTGAPSGTSTNDTSASGVRFSRCMRANGAPSFPDPGPGGYLRSALNLQSPAVQRAMNACTRYLSQPGQPPQVPAHVRHQELLFAGCMRANGVPNFPDPNANGDIQFPVTSPIPRSPTFQRAQNGPCRKYLGP
jgi:hypothetical protein